MRRQLRRCAWRARRGMVRGARGARPASVCVSGGCTHTSPLTSRRIPNLRHNASRSCRAWLALAAGVAPLEAPCPQLPPVPSPPVATCGRARGGGCGGAAALITSRAVGGGSKSDGAHRACAVTRVVTCTRAQRTAAVPRSEIGRAALHLKPAARWVRDTAASVGDPPEVEQRHEDAGPNANTGRWTARSKQRSEAAASVARVRRRCRKRGRLQDVIGALGTAQK